MIESKTQHEIDNENRRRARSLGELLASVLLKEASTLRFHLARLDLETLDTLARQVLTPSELIAAIEADVEARVTAEVKERLALVKGIARSTATKLPRAPKPPAAPATSAPAEGSSETDERVFGFVKAKMPCALAEIVDVLGIPKSAVKVSLDRLIARGSVIQTGKARSTKYEQAPAAPSELAPE